MALIDPRGAVFAGPIDLALSLASPFTDFQLTPQGDAAPGTLAVNAITWSALPATVRRWD
jgi:hypothetical protein